MKRYFLILFLTIVNAVAVFGEGRQRYLVFIFDNRYYMDGEKLSHGLGYFLWIIPYDACKDSICENDMLPLLVDGDDDIVFDHDFYDIYGIGRITSFFSPSKKTPIANKFFKKRKLIQSLQTDFFTLPRSKEIIRIYCIPIIAKCRAAQGGFFKTTFIVFDNEPIIWNDFWKELDSKPFNHLLHHNFINFDYVVAFDLKNKLPEVWKHLFEQ